MCAMMTMGAGAAMAQPVQWRVQDGGNGHWYEGVFVSSQGTSWANARSLALAKGGDLVSLNTLQERQWVFANIVDRPGLWTNWLGPWIGAMQTAGSVEPSGGWKWVDGTTFTPIRGDPPTYGGFYMEGNDSCCGAANRMSYWTDYGRARLDLVADGCEVSRWRCWNVDFGEHTSFIMEYSADCNNDGIVDKGQILSGELPDANNNGIPDWSLTITRQPANQAVGVDQPVFFDVEVASSTGCTTPTVYRWQRRNPQVLDANAPDAWIDLQDGGGFLNTGTAAMAIQRPTAGLATGYRCRISGGCGCEGIGSGVMYTNIVNFAPACPSDFNNDGSVDGDDVITFFERWDSGC
jgi:hypothetical protein